MGRNPPEYALPDSGRVRRCQIPDDHWCPSRLATIEFEMRMRNSGVRINQATGFVLNLFDLRKTVRRAILTAGLSSKR